MAFEQGVDETRRVELRYPPAAMCH
jgi:hypothetical protein